MVKADALHTLNKLF